QVFDCVRALAAGPAARRRLHLTAVLDGTLPAAGSAVTCPARAGVLGVLRAARAEHPRWEVRCLDLEATGGVADVRGGGDAAGRGAERGADAETVLGAPSGRPVLARRAGRWLTQVFRPLPDAAGQGAASPWRARGVHLIAGGAGGIGYALSRHLARTTAADVVWLGRRPATDATVTERLAAVEAAGGRARYVQGDVSRPEDVRAALAVAHASFGPVTTAVHAALDLRDRTLAFAGADDLRSAMLAKDRGVRVLHEILRDEPLDHFVLFSSAVSAIDSPGQAAYAAASTVEDALGRALHARGSVPVTVVNWGYWGSVGAVAGPQRARAMAETGVGSIEPADGFAALERILAARTPQALVARATPRALRDLGLVVEEAAAEKPGAEEAFARDAFVGEAVGGDTVVGGAVAQEAEPVAGKDPLDTLAGALLAAELTAAGALPAPGERLPAATTAQRLAVQPAPHRLFEALLPVLERAGAVRRDGSDLVGTGPVPVPPAAVPEAEEDLLRRCTAALPDVLAGRRNPLEVLFPGGSTDGLARFYGGGPAERAANRDLAARVRRHVDATGSGARILEIGAGTGATTRVVLAALADAAPLAYSFTDLSPTFLRQAEDTLRPDAPPSVALEFARFDVEQDPAAQGFGADHDVVIVAGVLHATTDVTTALRNAARLLRPGGLLLVHETTGHSDFLTLTFGLTQGWWRYQDPELRLPHSPLLAPATWRTVAGEAGLDDVEVRTSGTADGPATPCLLTARRTRPTGEQDPTATVTPDTARQYVRSVFADVLRHDPENLGDHTAFDEFGVDSLVSLTLVARFEADLGPLPSTLLFEHLTIAALADHLRTERADRLAAATAPQRAAAPTVSAVPTAQAVPAASTESTASAPADDLAVRKEPAVPNGPAVPDGSDVPAGLSDRPVPETRPGI
ncbi:SDR family NAD(P)-dependent oxidoreductase, partial [Streptomyces sp. H28]|uniref:SDR family NAD(P)-dependent oxidoreductase n=1 Tax=Streptomyces sp. H28 TaxID=2775865 RepID=UPI00177C85F3